jgi:hypothetical protein
MIGTFIREEQTWKQRWYCEREREREERGWGAERGKRERERENKGERQACALREQRTCLVRRTCKHERTNERTNEFPSSSSPNASFHYCDHIFIQQAYYWGGCMPIIVLYYVDLLAFVFLGVWGGSVGGWLGNLQKSSLPPPSHSPTKKRKKKTNLGSFFLPSKKKRIPTLWIGGYC